MNGVLHYWEPQVVAAKYWTDLGGKIRILEGKLKETWNHKSYPMEFASCYQTKEKGPVSINSPFY